MGRKNHNFALEYTHKEHTCMKQEAQKKEKLNKHLIKRRSKIILRKE
jgi:hypothetical protein